MDTENKPICLHITYQGRLITLEKSLTVEVLSKRIQSGLGIDTGLFKIAGLMDFKNVYYPLDELHLALNSRPVHEVFQLCVQYKDIHLKKFKKEFLVHSNPVDERVRKAATSKPEPLIAKQPESAHYIDFFKIAHKLDNIENFLEKEAEAFNYRYIITFINSLTPFNVDLAVARLFKKADIFYYLCKDVEKFKKNTNNACSEIVGEFNNALLDVENQMICMHGAKVHRAIEFLKDPISVEMTIKKLLNESGKLAAKAISEAQKVADTAVVKSSVLAALETLSFNSLISIEEYLYIKTIVLTNPKVFANLVDKKEINNKTNFASLLMRIKEGYELKPADLGDNHLVSILSDIGNKYAKYKDSTQKIKDVLISLCHHADQEHDRSPGNNKNDMLRYLKYFFIEFMTAKIDIEMFLTNLQNDVMRMTSAPQKNLGIESCSLRDSTNEFESQKVYNSEVGSQIKKEEIESVFVQIKGHFGAGDLMALRNLIEIKDENLINAFDLFLMDGDAQDFVETLQIILENLHVDNKRKSDKYSFDAREMKLATVEKQEASESMTKQIKSQTKNEAPIMMSNGREGHSDNLVSQQSMNAKYPKLDSLVKDTPSVNTNCKTVISFGIKQQLTKLPNGTFSEMDNKLKHKAGLAATNELRMSDDSDDKKADMKDKVSNSDYGISVKTVSVDNSDKENELELIASSKREVDKSSPPQLVHSVIQKTDKAPEHRRESHTAPTVKPSKPQTFIVEKGNNEILDFDESNHDIRFEENYIQQQENIFAFDQNEQMSPMSPMKFSVDSSLVNNSKSLFSPKSKRMTQNNILKYTNLEKNTNRGSSFFINSKTKRRSNANRGKHLIQLQNVNDSAIDNDTSVISGMKSQYMSVFGDLSQKYCSEDDKVQLYDYLLEKTHTLSQEIFNNIVLFYKNVVPDANVLNFETKLKQHLKKNAKNVLPMFFKFKWKPINNMNLVTELDMYLYNVDVPEYTMMDDRFGQKRKEIVEFYYSLLDFLCTPCKHLSNNQVSFFRTQLYIKDCYVLYGNLEYFLATNNIEDFVDNLFEYEKHMTHMSQSNQEPLVLDQSKFEEIESKPTHLSQIINRLTTNEERNTFLTLIKMGDEDLMGLINDELARNSSGGELISKVRKYLKAAKSKLDAMRKAVSTKNWREGLKETFEFMPQQKMDYIKNMDFIYELLDNQISSFEADILESMYMVWEITKDKGDFLENLHILDRMLNHKKHKDDIDRLRGVFTKQQLDENFASMFIQVLFEDQNQNTKVASDMFKIFKITKDERLLCNSVRAMFTKKSN